MTTRKHKGFTLHSGERLYTEMPGMVVVCLGVTRFWLDHGDLMWWKKIHGLLYLGSCDQELSEGKVVRSQSKCRRTRGKLIVPVHFTRETGYEVNSGHYLGTGGFQR